MFFKMPTHHPSQMKNNIHPTTLQKSGASLWSLHMLEKGGSQAHSTLQGARNEGWNEPKFPSTAYIPWNWSNN
jgi:hypothetical protein